MYGHARHVHAWHTLIKDSVNWSRSGDSNSLLRIDSGGFDSSVLSLTKKMHQCISIYQPNIYYLSIRNTVGYQRIYYFPMNTRANERANEWERRAVRSKRMRANEPASGRPSTLRVDFIFFLHIVLQPIPAIPTHNLQSSTLNVQCTMKPFSIPVSAPRC